MANPIPQSSGPYIPKIRIPAMESTEAKRLVDSPGSKQKRIEFVGTETNDKCYAIAGEILRDDKGKIIDATVDQYKGREDAKKLPWYRLTRVIKVEIEPAEGTPRDSSIPQFGYIRVNINSMRKRLGSENLTKEIPLATKDVAEFKAFRTTLNALSQAAMKKQQANPPQWEEALKDYRQALVLVLKSPFKERMDLSKDIDHITACIEKFHETMKEDIEALRVIYGKKWEVFKYLDEFLKIDPTDPKTAKKLDLNSPEEIGREKLKEIALKWNLLQDLEIQIKSLIRAKIPCNEPLNLPKIKQIVHNAVPSIIFHYPHALRSMYETTLTNLQLTNQQMDLELHKLEDRYPDFFR